MMDDDRPVEALLVTVTGQDRHAALKAARYQALVYFGQPADELLYKVLSAEANRHGGFAVRVQFSLTLDEAGQAEQARLHQPAVGWRQVRTSPTKQPVIHLTEAKGVPDAVRLVDELRRQTGKGW